MSVDVFFNLEHNCVSPLLLSWLFCAEFSNNQLCFDHIITGEILFRFSCPYVNLKQNDASTGQVQVVGGDSLDNLKDKVYIYH